MSELLTEDEWRARDDLRKYWHAFCDCDVIPIDTDDFTDRLEKFGLIEFSTFTKRDAGQTSFMEERGLEIGGPCWKLTAKGHAVYDKIEV